jgi:hypothetical protein
VAVYTPHPQLCVTLAATKATKALPLLDFYR